MATVEDYIGKKFGQFEIGPVQGQGKEADVFACLHLSTGLFYILRLDANDKEIWSGQPIIPPYNYSIESKNAKGTWLSAPGYYMNSFEEESLFTSLPYQKKEKVRKEWVFSSTAIYGVLDNRYLIPIASPVRVKSAWDVDKLIQTPINANIHSYFELWEDVVSCVVAEAFTSIDSKIKNDEWRKRWGRLLGGEVLIESVKRFMENGNSEDNEKTKILNMISNHNKENPVLVDNLLFKLCACIERRKITLDEVKATLKCKHFRINISHDEIQQLLDLYSIFDSQYFPPKNSLLLMQFVLRQLENKPVDEFDDPDEFEIRIQQPSFDHYRLFLQEFAAYRQEILTLTPY